MSSSHVMKESKALFGIHNPSSFSRIYLDFHKLYSDFINFETELKSLLKKK